MWDRIKLFLNPIDARYEDMRNDKWYLYVVRDFSAGLIVAMMAIPLAMGFAMASGLKPEQGIVGGAVAGLVGALFGGSKYQVYGPTAAFIPIIAGFMAVNSPTFGVSAAHGMLVTGSIIAGVILMIMGLTGLGRFANAVPHSVVVGFTIGIAVTIALSQISEVFGLTAGYKITGKEIEELKTTGLPRGIVTELARLEGKEFATRAQFRKELSSVIVLEDLEKYQKDVFKKCEQKMPTHFFDKLRIIWAHLGEFQGTSLLLALLTFRITQDLLKVSIYLPAPLIAIGAGILLTGVLSSSEIRTVGDKYGAIPTDFWVITPPVLPSMDTALLYQIGYLVVAIVFVSSVESLLCSRMADRLADNRGTPFNPDKEFWGQGLVQVLVPLLNGFPHTGALARTATNIKLGAVTPLAGIFKCFLKLMLAFYLARYLEMVPMACIGGILMWVAFNMVKISEVRQILRHGWFHGGLMLFTAVMVIVTEFVTGVLSAMILYGLLYKFFDKPPPLAHQPIVVPTTAATEVPTAK